MTANIIETDDDDAFDEMSRRILDDLDESLQGAMIAIEDYETRIEKLEASIAEKDIIIRVLTQENSNLTDIVDIMVWKGEQT